jgi:hypothetical protein
VAELLAHVRAHPLREHRQTLLCVAFAGMSLEMVVLAWRFRESYRPALMLSTTVMWVVELGGRLLTYPLRLSLFVVLAKFAVFPALPSLLACAVAYRRPLPSRPLREVVLMVHRLRKNAPRLVLSAFAATSVLAGCSGGASAVRADRSRYPISFSSGIPRQDGRTLAINQGLEVVGEVHKRYKRWFTLYGAAPRNSSIDVSEDLNRMVADARGDGVADFSVGARQCGANWIPLLRFLPFWVGCLIVDIDGKIVKVHD